MQSLATLKFDLAVIESEIANPPAYILDVSGLHRNRKAILRKIARLEAKLESAAA